MRHFVTFVYIYNAPKKAKKNAVRGCYLKKQGEGMLF